MIVQKLVSEHNGSDFVFAEDTETKKELWKVSFVTNHLVTITYNLYVQHLYDINAEHEILCLVAVWLMMTCILQL